MESLGMVATEEDAKDDEEDQEDETVEQPKIEITKEQRKYLKEFVLASKITTSFYSSNTGLIGWLTNSNVGAIKVYRIGENGKKQLLKRVDETQLMPMYAEQEASDEWLTYFAVDEYDKLYIVTKDRATGAFSKQEVEFFDGVLNENAISVMFFIDLCLTTQNPKYVSDLAKEVIKKTQIEIWLLENGQTTTVTTTVPDGDNLLWFKVDSVTKTQNSSEDIRAIVGKAQTLLYEYERDIISNTDKSEEEHEEKDKDGNVTKKIKTEIYKYYNIKGVYKNARVKYKESDPFPKYSNTEYEILNSKGVQTAYKSLEDGGDNMFENMSRNIDNDRLVQVLKYVMYKMTNRSYGVTELDLDLGTGGISLTGALEAMIISWENPNVETNYSEGDSYKVFEYEGGLYIYAGIKLYKNGEYFNVSSFSSRGVDLQEVVAEYYSTGKALINKQIIQDIFSEMLQVNYREPVERATAGLNLTSYQIDALVCICYRFGTENANNFPEAYKRYGSTDELRLNWVCPYIQKHPEEGPSSFHRTSDEWETRRSAAEWRLFTEGVYELSDGTVVTQDYGSGTVSGDTIIGAQIGTVTLKGANKQKMINMLNKAVEICDDPNVRYSQAYRGQTIGGIIYWDCSSFVHYLYQTYFGMSIPSYSSGYGTGTASTEFNMSEDNRQDISRLKPGDVLWRPGHVAIYIGNGLIAHARGDESWGLYEQDQVAVCRLGAQAKPFTKVYRFVE